MKEITLEKLKIWAVQNNWNTPHPSDKERFYDFIIESFNNEDTDIRYEKFREIVSFYFKDEETIENNYIEFENGVGLLVYFNDYKKMSTRK